MKRELIFHISSAAGIQLRTVQRLKQIGMLTTKRSFKEAADGNRYMVLEVQGADVPDETIWSQVCEIEGIISLMRQSEQQAEPPQDASAPQDAAPAFIPESGDPAIRDRMLIFSLLSRYPRLDGRFNEILSAIPPEIRRQRALEIGLGFGSHLARQVDPKKPPTKLADSMTELLIPALSPIATLRLEDRTMTIGDNRIDLNGKGHREETCDFLKGTITGLLRAYNLASLLVGNQCRNDSAGESCLFLFAPKPAT